MNEASRHMIEVEPIDLFVATPSNIPTKSIEAHRVALALAVEAFVGKKCHLITVADSLFQQLQQTKVPPQGTMPHIPIENREVDFTSKRGLCSLLLGKVDECRAWLGLDSDNSPYRNPSIIDFIRDDYENDLPGFCLLLKTWLMEVVFPRFRDPRDVQFKLGDYYKDLIILTHLDRRAGAAHSPLTAAGAIVKIGSDAVIDRVRRIQFTHCGRYFPLVNRLRMWEEKKILPYLKIILEKNMEEIPKEELITDKIKQASVMSAGVAIGVMTLVGLRSLASTNGLLNRKKEIDSAMTSNIIHAVNSVGDSLDQTSVEELTRMNARLAEDIVRGWQDIKTQASEAEKALNICQGNGPLCCLEVLTLWKHLPDLKPPGSLIDFSINNSLIFHLEDKVKVKGKGIDRPQSKVKT